MTDKDLYSTILGVCLPWQVADVTLDVDRASVTVRLEYPAAADGGFPCPTCGTPAPVYDRREARTWRHLDSCQFQTYLSARLPRVSCPTHGVLTAGVFWAESDARFTLLFEAFAIRVLQATGVQSRAASLLGLSPGQVHDLMERAVLRGLARRDRSQPLAHLSVDEKSHHVHTLVNQSGHRYISVVSDPVGKRVLDVTEGRTQEAVATLFAEVIPEELRGQVRSVSMDMWPPFLTAREALFPDADTVHDRYHIAAYLGEAVDKTRRSENRELTKEKDTRLGKTKYLWLRSAETLTDKQKTALDALTCLDLETAKVWAFKESFRGFFACPTRDQAATYFENWREGALALGNVHLTRVARMLSKHLEGLLSYIEHRVTNATAESLNALIQQIKANAKGFRKGESFGIAILFFLGKLDLQPNKTS